MSFSKIYIKPNKKIILPVSFAFALFYSIAILLSGYGISTIANSELVSCRLFFSNPGNILDTYHHWIPNLIGSLIIKFSGKYSIFALRFFGFIVILIISYFLYMLLSNYFNNKLSLLSTLFSLIFILSNYTIFNSSLFTSLIYIMFIYFVVQAVTKNKDYLFFFAGILLTLNFFSDCQNILCILCLFGIFIYYKIAKVPNNKQNKQFIPLLSGIFISSIILLLAMNILGVLNYYINSVYNSYNLFEHSIGIYSDINLLKIFKSLIFNYLYWPILIFVILFVSDKLINFKNNKYIFAAGIIVISPLITYLIKDNWQYIFIGISFGVLLLYIFNIMECSNDFKLMCILALIEQILLNSGILRSNSTLIYGIGIGLSLEFIVSVNLILNNLNIIINIYKEGTIKILKFKMQSFSFILVSILLIYIICSVKAISNKSSLLIFDNASVLSNQNYINTQIKNGTDSNEVNEITECIKKYSNTSDLLLVPNNMNISFFTTGKAPLLDYTIYDEDTIPLDIQIKTNIQKYGIYPIAVIRKDPNNALYYNAVTNFVNKNKYKSVYKSNTSEVFIPVTH